MKMKILFSRVNPLSEPGGFDMGNVSIEFKGKEISSNGNSRNLMMIYIAIPDLIFGVLGLQGARGIYNFVGADSSFLVKFKSRENEIEISYEGVKMVCKKSDFFNALCSGVDDFLASGNELKISDSMHSDLHVAIEKLRRSRAGY